MFALMHYTLPFLAVMSSASIVYDENNQRVESKSYCKQMGTCPPGLHVICRYGADMTKLGPRCGGGKRFDISVQKNHLLDLINEARRKLTRNEVQGLPKAYGMMKLYWNDTLAEFAQVWANQCNYGRDRACVSTFHFPNSYQIKGVIRFTYPDWKYNQSVVPEGRREKFVIETFVQLLYADNKAKINKDIIEKTTEETYNNPYLVMVHGYTTEVGCGASVFVDYFKQNYSLPQIYTVVLMVCTFSNMPEINGKVYETSHANHDTSGNCGCGPKSHEDDCLCAKGAKQSSESKEKDKNEKGKGSDPKEKGENDKGKSGDYKEKGKNDKEKGGESKEKGENNKGKGGDSKEKGENVKGKGDDSKEKSENVKGKGDGSKEKGENVKGKGDYSKEKGENAKGKGDDSKEKGENVKGKSDDSKEKGENAKGKGDDSKEKGENVKGKGDDSKEKGENAKGNGDDSKKKGENDKEQGSGSKEKSDSEKAKGDDEKGDTTSGLPDKKLMFIYKNKKSGPCKAGDRNCQSPVVVMPIFAVEDADSEKLEQIQKASKTPPAMSSREARQQSIRQRIRSRVQTVRNRYFGDTHNIMIQPGTRFFGGGPVEGTFPLPLQPESILNKKSSIHTYPMKNRPNIDIKPRKDFSNLEELVSEYLTYKHAQAAKSPPKYRPSNDMGQTARKAYSLVGDDRNANYEYAANVNNRQSANIGKLRYGVPGFDYNNSPYMNNVNDENDQLSKDLYNLEQKSEDFALDDLMNENIRMRNTDSTPRTYDNYLRPTMENGNPMDYPERKDDVYEENPNIAYYARTVQKRVTRPVTRYQNPHSHRSTSHFDYSSEPTKPVSILMNLANDNTHHRHIYGYSGFKTRSHENKNEFRNYLETMKRIRPFKPLHRGFGDSSEYHRHHRANSDEEPAEQHYYVPDRANIHHGY